MRAVVADSKVGLSRVRPWSIKNAPDKGAIMFKSRFCAVVAAILLLCAFSVQAAPITFNFRFESPTNAAQAVGSITFESTLLPNPGSANIALPDPAVLALSVTISGATAGNGTFTLADFCQINWDTNTATLDFNQQLVGQSTPDEPWGTTYPTGTTLPMSGDFNLLSQCGPPPGASAAYGAGSTTAPNATNGTPAPNGVWWFTLRPGNGNNNGTADPDDMQLVSMIQAGAAPVTTAVPALDARMLLLLAALMAAGGLLAMRRRQA